jgi:hypothetical protein
MKRYYVNQEGAAGLHGRAHPSLHGNAGHQGGELDLPETITREKQYAPAFCGLLRSSLERSLLIRNCVRGYFFAEDEPVGILKDQGTEQDLSYSLVMAPDHCLPDHHVTCSRILLCRLPAFGYNLRRCGITERRKKFLHRGDFIR